MKKNVCTYFSIIIILILALMIPSISYAKDKEKKDTSSQEGSSSFGIDLGDLDKYKKDDTNLGTLEDKAESIIGIITTIGVVVSVVSLIAIGIKYMLGSIEEKAQYKETLKPYIIGAFIVFTVSLIPEIIYQFMQNL